jgi:glycosyltransferase involved in cell wall biosynthesis
VSVRLSSAQAGAARPAAGGAAAASAAPLRVAFVISGLLAAGAERQLTALAHRLVARGHPVLVVSITAGGAQAEPLRRGGVEVVDLGVRPGRLPNPWTAWKGIRHLLAWRADVVHSFMFHATLLARLLGVLRRPALQVSSVRTSGEHRGVRALGYRLTDRLCDVVTHVTADEAEAFVARRVTRRRVVVIPNGVDLSRPVLPRAPREPGAPFRWIAVGRLQPAKDYPGLLAAFRRVLDAGCAAELSIAGEGAVRQALEDEVRRLGLEGSVRLLGHRDDVERLFAEADGYVLSSVREGMPNALLEASWAGLPVVATRVGAVEGIVAAFGNGAVVPPGDPGALADAMLDLMARSPAERERLGASGREGVRARHALDAMVDRWSALYAAAAGGRATA